MTTIPAGEFKAKCLQILDQVGETRESVTVTKRGKPVARIMPLSIEDASSYGAAKGTISYAEADDLLSTGEGWDSEA